MELNGKKITLHDMTLRDGMHPKRSTAGWPRPPRARSRRRAAKPR